MELCLKCGDLEENQRKHDISNIHKKITEITYIKTKRKEGLLTDGRGKLTIESNNKLKQGWRATSLDQMPVEIPTEIYERGFTENIVRYIQHNIQIS